MSDLYRLEPHPRRREMSARCAWPAPRHHASYKHGPPCPEWQSRQRAQQLVKTEPAIATEDLVGAFASQDYFYVFCRAFRKCHRCDFKPRRGDVLPEPDRQREMFKVREPTRGADAGDVVAIETVEGSGGADLVKGRIFEFERERLKRSSRCRMARPAIALESMPALNQAPTVTSLRRCIFTHSSSLSRTDRTQAPSGDARYSSLPGKLTCR